MYEGLDGLPNLIYAGGSDALVESVGILLIGNILLAVLVPFLFSNHIKYFLWGYMLVETLVYSVCSIWFPAWLLPTNVVLAVVFLLVVGKYGVEPKDDTDKMDKTNSDDQDNQTDPNDDKSDSKKDYRDQDKFHKDK